MFFGAFGGGNADDVGELAGVKKFAEFGDDEGGGGAGAEAEDHAAFDIFNGFIGGEFFEVVLSEGYGFDFDGEGRRGFGA